MKPIAATSIALLALAVLQQTAAERMSILGARPDFLLLTTIILGQLSSRSAGAVLGFAAGVLHGGLAGAGIGVYAISRSATGFAASWSKGLGYAPNAVTIVMLVVLGTVFGEMIWMFIALRSGVGAFLGATIGTAIYNGVLAVPLYALLKRLVAPPRR